MNYSDAVKMGFVPYEPSLRLKELGFDEPCLAYHTIKKDIIPLQHIGYEFNELKNSEINNTYCSSVAPTYQQAFRWFREKYEIYYTIEGSKKFGFQHFIYDEKGSYEIKSEEIFKNYEEAELACLIKLIEIVEKKQENDK